jgi:hypothetical protein
MWCCFAHLKMLLVLCLAAVLRHHPWNKHKVSATLDSTACDGTSSTALNTICPDIPACFLLSCLTLSRIFVRVGLFGPNDGLVDCCADSTGILVCSIVSPDPLATAFGLIYPDVCFCFNAAISFCLSVYEPLLVTAKIYFSKFT